MGWDVMGWHGMGWDGTGCNGMGSNGHLFVCTVSRSEKKRKKANERKKQNNYQVENNYQVQNKQTYNCAGSKELRFSPRHSHP